MKKQAIWGSGLAALAVLFAGCEDGPSAPSTGVVSSTEATPSALTIPTAQSTPLAGEAASSASSPSVATGVATVDRTLASGTPFVASLTGGGSWDLIFGEFVVGNVLAVNAKRLANGEVQGQIEYQQTFQGEVFRFHGPVTCISAYDDGTRAKFGGPITRSNDPTIPVGVFMWFTVTDNGDGASGELDKATIFGIGDEQANEDFCASPAPPPALFFTEVTSGDFSVDG